VVTAIATRFIHQTGHTGDSISQGIGDAELTGTSGTGATGRRLSRRGDSGHHDGDKPSDFSYDTIATCPRSLRRLGSGRDVIHLISICLTR